MSAFVSRKLSLLILLAGLLAASGTVFLLKYALAGTNKGPKLGKIYDFLLEQRPSPPVAHEILLIDTEEIIESGDVLAVLMALTEFEAACLLLETPVLGSTSSKIGNIEEIRRNLQDEYRLLGQNIRNLFEAIRVGSVPPTESAEYVERIIELAERGRDRLGMALVSQSGDASHRISAAASLFGPFWEALDLRDQPPDIPWYSRPLPDPDGKLRRIAPLLPGASFFGEQPVEHPVEHIAYHSLKPRWEKTEIEFTEEGPTLVMRHVPSETPYTDEDAESGGNEAAGGAETRIVLDSGGGLLFERPRGETQFRRLQLDRFHAYGEADRVMGRLLKDAEILGAYSGTRPERIPLFLRDYAASIQEESLKDGGRNASEKRAAWIASRAAYMESLAEFLDGPAETALISGFDEILATEKLKEEGRTKLLDLRSGIIGSFDEMRKQHLILKEARAALSEALASSFCIMGPAIEDGQRLGRGPRLERGAESSALLANALITGIHIKPEQERYVLFWSLLAVFAVLAGIHAFRPHGVLLAGTAASLVCAAGFGWSFILLGRWIDPLIPSVSCFAGTLLIFFARLAVMRRGAYRFRFAYAPVVAKPVLDELIRCGKPLLSETAIAKAAVIAIKDPSLPGREDREKPADAAKSAAEFRRKVVEIFREAGAAIVAYEGDTVIACFGSPPERVYLERTRAETLYGDEPNAHSSHHPATKAVGFITELLHHEKIDWRFGIDCGNCAFSWSPETGYTANGRPVVRARVLSGLASRYKAQVLISDSVREKLNQPAKKLGSLGTGGNGEIFYELKLV